MQVDNLRGDEGAETDAKTEPFPDRVEDGALRDRRDAAAHLRVHDDADHSHHDGPEQLVAELRSGPDVEDKVADVDEAPDRGEDAKRELEDLLHLASCFASAAAFSSRDFKRPASARSPGAR